MYNLIPQLLSPVYEYIIIVICHPTHHHERNPFFLLFQQNLGQKYKRAYANSLNYKFFLLIQIHIIREIIFIQVIKILLDRGALLPMPHDIRCPRNLQYCPPYECKLLVLVFVYLYTCILVLVLVPNIYKGVVAKIALSPVGRIV